MNLPKKVSVSDELHTLELAVDGARRLAQLGEESDEHETRRLQPRIGAILAVVIARLHQFDRVVRGEVDPADFRAPHNTVEEDGEEEREEQEDGEETGDLRIEDWPPDKLREHGEDEIERAKALEKEAKGIR